MRLGYCEWAICCSAFKLTSHRFGVLAQYLVLVGKCLFFVSCFALNIANNRDDLGSVKTSPPQSPVQRIRSTLRRSAPRPVHGLPRLAMLANSLRPSSWFLTSHSAAIGASSYHSGFLFSSASSKTLTLAHLQGWSTQPLPVFLRWRARKLHGGHVCKCTLQAIPGR